MKLKYLTLVMAMTLPVAMTGCVSTGDDGEQAAVENRADMDRFEYVASLKGEMEEVGFEVEPVHTVLDRVTTSVNEVYKHQYDVVSDYRTVTEHHRDVQSFLFANKDKDAAALEAAVMAFDANAATAAEKIGPKLAAYNQANDEIFKKNIELTIELGKQAYIMSELLAGGYSQFLTAETATSLFKAGAIKDEWNNVQRRIELAQEANDMIQVDRDTIEIAKQMQSIQL